MKLTEVGSTIVSARVEAGLSQAQLAKFAGLSRVTVNQLENGSLDEIGYAKLTNILGILGLNLQLQATTGLKSALAIAARSISTSYRDAVTPESLAQILRSGVVPAGYRAHISTLLDETPLPLIVKTVKEAATKEAPAKKIMKHLTNWAHEWKIRRPAFDN